VLDGKIVLETKKISELAHYKDRLKFLFVFDV